MQTVFPDEWLPQGQWMFPRLTWRRGNVAKSGPEESNRAKGKWPRCF
jgi:hypothetical protein